MDIIISELSFICSTEHESRIVRNHLDNNEYEFELLDTDPDHVIVLDHLSMDEVNELITNINKQL